MLIFPWEKLSNVILASVGWHSPHSGWGSWFGCQEWFPCPFTTILSHPETSNQVSMKCCPYRISLLIQGWLWKSRPQKATVQLLKMIHYTRQASLTQVPSGPLHVSVRPPSFPGTTTKKMQFCIFFLKAKYFKLKPVALFPLQNQTNKWNFSVGKKVTNQSSN